MPGNQNQQENETKKNLELSQEELANRLDVLEIMMIELEEKSKIYEENNQQEEMTKLLAEINRKLIELYKPK